MPGILQLVEYAAQGAQYTDLFSPPNFEHISYEKMVIKVKNNKLKDKKCITDDCNICYNDNLEVYKCNNCVFLVCESCYIKTKDYKCVHCKNNF